MSLDLLKNILCQAFTTAIPGLVTYPERVDAAVEVFPNLSFVKIRTTHIDVPRHQEVVRIPNPDTSQGSAPYLVTPVIARKRSTIRLQLRDRLGDGETGASLHERFRNQHNAIDRFLSETRSMRIGPVNAQTIAELWYDGDQEEYDPTSALFLHTYRIRIDPWRLLEAGSGSPAYRADQIALDVSRERDGALLITRVHPPHQ